MFTPLQKFSYRSRLCVWLTGCLAMLASGGMGTTAADTEARPKGVATWPQVTLWLRDGTRLTGTKVDQLTGAQGPTLDGKPLGNQHNPLRTIRWRAAALPRGPAVELANGDLLPGTIIDHRPAAADGSSPGCFVVAPTRGSIVPGQSKANHLVRETAVRRIVRSLASAAPLLPGRLMLRDGRTLQVRSVRFADDEVHIFTAEGIKRLELAEIGDFDLPQVDPLADSLADGAWSEPGDLHSVMHVRTLDGQQLTFDRRLCRPGDYGGFYVRPNWSLITHFLASDELAWITLRSGNEIPLSRLAVEVSSVPAGGPQPWLRNRGVSGSELRVGSLASELGIGVQASATLAWELPPGATRFTAAVGIDEAVGNGGCVRCEVRLDGTDSSPLWRSGFLRGSDPPASIGPLNLPGAGRLVLSAEMAHAERPPGADPLDIRDHVAWLMPLVTVDPAGLPRPTDDLGRWIPQLAGWQVPEHLRPRAKIKPAWNKYTSGWELTFSAADRDPQPVELERKLRVTLANSRLVMVAASDGEGSGGYEVQVLVDGQPCVATLNGNINTSGTAWKRPVDREHNLGEFVGREVTLKLALVESGSKREQPTGLDWRTLALLPLIENLPGDALPLTPDVWLTSLTPLETRLSGKPKPLAVRAGELSKGKPLEIRGARFTQGFAVPSQFEITYALSPAWKRLVAVIGLADGWQGAGPYEVLLDGQLHWRSPRVFDRNSPGLQVDLPIPAGHQKITLRALGRESACAWANAGFSTK